MYNDMRGHGGRHGWHRHGAGGMGGPRGFGGFGHGRGGFDGAGDDGRPHGRGRRMFEGGELRLVLLKMIADAPRHGYELIKAIEELTGGAYVPSPGLVYPSLTMLGEMGLIEEQASEGARKRFAATPEGIAHVAEKAAEIEAVMARLAALDHERNRVAWNRLPIRRAMGNLREAVRNRFEQGDLSDERLHDMAALIDGVAQQIERLK